MIFQMLISALFSLSYDPCGIGKSNLDSLRAMGIKGDSSAIQKMACVATCGVLDESESLFWRYRRIEIYPCGATELEYLLEPWSIAVQIIAAHLKHSQTFLCHEKMENSIIRLCRNDSLRSYAPCNQYRKSGNSKKIIARDPPLNLRVTDSTQMAE